MPSAPSTRAESSAPHEQRPTDALNAHLAEVCGSEVDQALLRRAVTHRSFSYEHGGVPHNERLEFLGDAVLGLVVTDELYRRHPDLPEGQLAKLRAAVVNSRALARVATGLGLGDALLLGRGEETTGGRAKASILADTTEAVIGAVYISVGLAAASQLVHHLIDPLLADAMNLGAALDWKTSLQELAAAGGHGVPRYVIEADGPDHNKTFTARVVIGDETYEPGSGHSKKAAEQIAAENAFRSLSATADGDGSPEGSATGDAAGSAPAGAVVGAAVGATRA